MKAQQMNKEESDVISELPGSIKLMEKLEEDEDSLIEQLRVFMGSDSSVTQD